MSRYVCDTHALHWHLVGNDKLSTTFLKCSTG